MQNFCSCTSIRIVPRRPHVLFVAERLSARHLILLCGRLTFVYTYIYPSRCLGTRTCCLGTSFHTWLTCTCTGGSASRARCTCFSVWAALSWSWRGSYMCCYAMEPEHSNPPRVLARELKRRQRANASAESLSTPACQSGNETTPAAARPDSTATDLREAFYCAFLRNTSSVLKYKHVRH